ncbi:MAG: 3-deoxy-8-phosphooctulonate synthase [Intestinibacter bartlettii]|uniref:3-deoxy-8-phosphooctulonate synthase n=1 Tax=Intestinibacter bartlettii TaxID=261299 RepID=UPI00399A2528
MNNLYIGGHKMFTLIAGPCAMESEEICMQTATEIKRITDKLGIPYVYKTSFDKANRTSISSYRGLGMEEGLRILQKVKDEVGVKVTTDIHESWQAEPVAKVVDILQIPAFLCRQTDLLVAAAKTGKTINVKKAQFLAPWDMKNVVGKLEDSGCKDIMVCERGTTFGYNNFVVDMTSLVEMKSFGYPVVFDATHSVQKPGGKGTSSDGNREFVEYLAKAAIAVGVDALFMEVHPDPDNAKCDGPNMVKLSDLEGLLTKLVDIYNAINK